MDQQLLSSPVSLTVLFIWSLLVKGIAVWRAANLKQRNWFVGILVLNTLGLIELVYLFKFCKKPLTLGEIKSWLPGKK